MPKKKLTKPGTAKKAKPTHAQGLRALADSWDANIETLATHDGAREELFAWWKHEGIGEGHDAETDEDAFNGWLAVTTVSDVDGRLYVETEYSNLVYVENLWMWEDEAEMHLDE